MSALTRLRAELDPEPLGQELYALVEELYPICRSITGDGFRQTQDIVRRNVPELELHAVPSGTQAFDWTVPKEWNIHDAYVKGPSGKKIIDFQKSNLHVVNYSVPVRAEMPLHQLKEHLHTLPDDPTLIPYRTSYYCETWGFCLTHEQYLSLEDGTYEVVIDSTLTDGHLNYGEGFFPGQEPDEVLISTHSCHPSLCNDNLSGVVVTTLLAKMLRELPTRYSYRFLFLPGGIGSVVWLSRNPDCSSRIKHGLVAVNLGDPGNFTYKRTRSGAAEIDQAVENVLRNSGKDHTVIDFSAYGYDERNFNSPKYKLPVGSLTRSIYSNFPGYHSSGDDLDLVSGPRLADSLLTYLEVLDVLESNGTYINLIPDAEPQLGKRGLYGLYGGLQKRERLELVLLEVMNFSDGSHSLLDISDRSGYPFDLVKQAALILCENDLLAPQQA